MVVSKRLGQKAPLQEVAVEKFRVASAWLRDYVTAIKNGQIHPFTSMERKVREASRNEPWGPTGTALNELAEASFNSTDCEIIFAVIQLRLGYPPEKWRNVYKALVLLDFLVLRGSQQCVHITHEELMYKLEDLETFAYTTLEGKDQGMNIRHRAKAIKELLLDNGRLQAERQTLLRKRKAYQGYTRDQLVSGKPFHDDQDIPTPTSARDGLRRTLSDSSMQESHTVFSGEGHRSLNQQPLQYRNAGETKGVTMEMNKGRLLELKKLLDLPNNQFCADCIGGGGAARASWASINTGVFLCMRCAGVHRGLGTHISKVRSCTLDTWLPEQVAFMARTGNACANSFFEAKLDPSMKPAYGSGDLEPFIRQKYVHRAFAAEGSWPPVSDDMAVPGPSRTQIATDSSYQEADNVKTGLTNAIESNANDAATAPTKRSQPRLQGSKLARQSNSGTIAKPLTRLVSVPLPNSAQGGPRGDEGSNTGQDLMGFGAEATAVHVPPTVQPTPQRDIFADLESLLPTVSLLDEATSPGNLGLESFKVLPEEGVMGFNDPPAFPSEEGARPYAQPSSPTSQHSTGTGSLPRPSTSCSTGNQLPPGGLLLPSPGIPPTPGFSTAQHLEPLKEDFQDESVTDWAAPVVTARRPQLAKLQVQSLSMGGESDPGSVTSSMSFLTPRMTALLGPGLGQGFLDTGVARPAPVKYAPPGIVSNFTATSKPMPALEQSTKQWMANSKEGNKGVLDELVLHAVAGLPPLKHGSLQDTLLGSQLPKPPSMLQQRAELVQQLST